MEQNVLLAMEEFEIAGNYWREKLSGELSEINIFPDYPGTPGCREANYSISFEKDLTGRLMQVSKSSNLSLFVVLLTGFKIFLYKLTHQPDIVVTSPVTDKSSQEFNKFVPLRDILDSQVTFKEALMQVRNTAAHGYKYQYYPIEKLQKLPDNKNSFSFFKTVLLLEGLHKKEYVEEMKWMENHGSDLIVSINRNNDTLAGNIRYNSKLFKEESISRLFSGYFHILDQALKDGGAIKINEIELISRDQKRKILFDFNNTQNVFPQTKTIAQWFEQQAEKRSGGNHTAVCFPIDLSGIHKELVSLKPVPHLFNKIRSCCFGKNPYIHRHDIGPDNGKNGLILLKTHRHNSVIVNHNTLRLIDLFNGEKNTKQVFSLINETKAPFLIYPVEIRDLLEITSQLNGKQEVYTAAGGEDFVSLVQSLYKNNLIDLVGFKPGEAVRGPQRPPLLREDPLPDGNMIPADIILHHKELSPARVLLLGDTPGMPSTGLLYLASYLRRNGISTYCQFYDSSEDYSAMKKNLEKLLETIRPELVAVSLKWFLYIARVLDICKIVKSFARTNSLDITVVVGGNTASYYWEKMIQCEYIDYLIRGDGEVPLLKICQKTPELEIPNAVFKKNGRAAANPISYIQDETDSPEIFLSHLQDILLSNHASVPGTFFIYTHKGCTMNCCYCGGCSRAQQEIFNRKKVLRRGVEEVRTDIMEALPYASTFQFDFDTTIDAQDLLNYCRAIWQGIGLAAHFCIISTLTPPSPALIQLAAKTFKYVYWDFDACTLSEKHREQLLSLGLVKPMPSDKEILAFLDRCEIHCNIEVRINLINGLPYSTTEDIAAGEEFLAKIINTYSCFGELHWARLHAQPGAPILESAELHNMYSYASTFEDFLEYSRKNFDGASGYSRLENLNYPYIYSRNDELNSEITRFYLSTGSKIRELREKKRGELIAPLTLTYRQLNEKTSRLAALLRKKGVTSDAIVGLMTAPSLEMITGLLAILKAGAAYLPIDPEHPQDRIRFMLKDSRSGLLLTQTRLTGSIQFGGETLDLENPDIYRSENTKHGYISKSTDIVYCIYTSGTTGKPKGVLVENINLVNYVHWFTRKARLTEADRTLLTSSYAFDLGFTSVYSSLLNGGQLHILPREVYLSAHRLLNYIQQNEISYIKVTPSLFSVFVNDPGFSSRRCHTLRLAVIGGEPINAKDIERAHNICPHLQVINHYGPTEATIGCIAQYIDFHCFEDYKNKPTIGKPIDNCSVYILDREMNVLPIGIPGELYIAGVCLARGYLNRPGLTAEKFRKYRSYRTYISYKTGDLARWMPDGTVEFLSRIDSQVKIRGYRIELEEIENRLSKHREIEKAAVIVREGENGDKYICAYYHPKKEPGKGDDRCGLSKEERTRYLRQMLLPGWGSESQEMLKRTTVFVAGAGGGASPTLVQLALLGFGTVIVCDYDEVELSNLNRQFLHDETRLGMNKALSAKITINTINPHVNVIPITGKITGENVFDLVGDAAVIFDMLDNQADKFILSECAAAKGIPHIISAMTDISSYTAVFHPPMTPCFHCLFDKNKLEALISGMKRIEKNYRKKSLPVAAPSLFVSTGFAVNEAVKIILGIRNPAYNRFFFFNQGGTEGIATAESFRAMTYTFSDHFRKLCKDQGFDWETGWRENFLEELKIKPNPDCPVCGKLAQDYRHIAPPGRPVENNYPLSKLREFLLRSLPEYMIPAYFVPLEEMPLTPNGKIDKRALPAPHKGKKGKEYTAPRNEIEIKLAEIWGDVLEIEISHIGIDDNFFQLGGHSLKVTLLVSRIHRELSTSLSLSEVFSTPTIRRQAEQIMQNHYTYDVSASTDENLVLLRKGTDNTKHLFLVHAGSGEVDGYLEFCSNLEPTFHCWGIRSSRIKDYTPVNITIEEIARKYVEKIKTIQQRGAYYLAGWCIGGTIVFEMVNRMEEKGEDIAFFSLINSDPPSVEAANSVRQFTAESESDLIFQLLPGNIDEIKEKIGGPAELSQFWLDLVDYLTANNIEPAVLRKLFPQNIAEAVPNFEQLEVKSLLYYLNTIRTFDNARNAYVPGRNINTPVYFFGARDAEVKNRHIWNDYCRQPFKFYQAAGDHFSIFRKPEVLEFSGLFTRVLNRVSSVKYIPDNTSMH